MRTITGRLARGGEPYVGLEGVEAYIRDVAQTWDEIELLPAEYHDLDDGRTLVLGRVRTRRGSTLLDSPGAWLWRVRDGRVLAAEVFDDIETAIATIEQE